jgi:hypothetical protein
MRETETSSSSAPVPGVIDREKPMPAISAIEIVAGFLTLGWLLIGALLVASGQGVGGVDAVLLALPVVVIWVTARLLRMIRALRTEAMQLQAAIDAMQRDKGTRPKPPVLDLKPAMVAKLQELTMASEPAPAPPAPAVFASQRSKTAAAGEAAETAPPTAAPQPDLALATPPERPPLSIAEFIKALNFPLDEHDREGFRTLRRALEDRTSERLVRASQDVLTLLSHDGIYMDDLQPDHTRPEIWRRFAMGERGRAIAALGGVHDRSSLALAAGRMKADPVFRDAVHHFLRHFDRTFMAFERNATDGDIVALANTRTARAFMLLGRAAGTFD